MGIVLDVITCIFMPTLICVDGLQVHDMSDDVVLVCDAVSSQHVSGLSGDIQGLATAVPLQHGDHLWSRSVKMGSHTLYSNSPFLQQREID